MRENPLFATIFDWCSTAERTNAFVTLVFGYSVVALLFQNKAAYGINAYVLIIFQVNLLIQSRFFGKAILGLIQAFSFNWLYFEIGTGEWLRYPSHTNVVLQIRGTYIHMPSAGTTCLVSCKIFLID